MFNRFKNIFSEKIPTWILLFILPPVGIYLLWKNKFYKKKTNIIFTCLFSLMFFSSMVSGEESASQDDSTNEDVIKEVTELEDEKEIEPDEPVEEVKIIDEPSEKEVENGKSEKVQKKADTSSKEEKQTTESISTLEKLIPKEMGIVEVFELEINAEMENSTVYGGKLANIWHADDGVFVAIASFEGVIESHHEFSTTKEANSYLKNLDEKLRKDDKQKQAKQAEDRLNKSFATMVNEANEVIVDIKQSPYTTTEYRQMWVVVSDVWYYSPEHEQERFAENVGATVKQKIYQSGVVEDTPTILVHFVDEYEKEVAKERVFGGYKLN